MPVWNTIKDNSHKFSLRLYNSSHVIVTWYNLSHGSNCVNKIFVIWMNERSWLQSFLPRWYFLIYFIVWHLHLDKLPSKQALCYADALMVPVVARRLYNLLPQLTKDFLALLLLPISVFNIIYMMGKSQQRQENWEEER